MLNINLDWYGNISKEEAISEYGWGSADIADDSPVFVNTTPENNVYVAQMVDGNWCCEIEGYEDSSDRYSWNMIGQGFGATAEQAIEDAVLDIVAIDVMREEGNCEDAVNVSAYEAYQFIYGETPMFQINVSNMDSLLGAARHYVKSNINRVDYEWEEF